jgi:hypothetical protein
LSARRIALAALPVAALLGALALFVPFDAPDLGRDVEERVRSAMGLDFAAARARVRLKGDVVLEDVRLGAGSYRARFSRIVLEQPPLSVLDPKVIRFESGRIESEAGAASIDSLELALDRLDHDPRALTGLHGLLLTGGLSVGRIAFGAREVRGLRAGIAVDNGRVRLEELDAALGPGSLSGEAVFDFNSLPFRYRASLGSPAFSLEGLGRGGLRLEVDGFGARARNLKGRGTFALEPGRIPDAAWAREVVPALAGTEHGPLEIAFEIRDERIYFGKLAIGGVELEGSVGFDGSRNVRVAARP